MLDISPESFGKPFCVDVWDIISEFTLDLLAPFHASHPHDVNSWPEAHGKERTYLTYTMRQWDTYRRPVRPYGREEGVGGRECVSAHTHSHTLLGL